LKNLLYISSVTEKSNNIGVWKKIQTQIKLFNKENINVNFFDINIRNKNRIINAIIKRLPFTGIYNWKIDKKLIKNCDCIYIRYNFSDYQFIKFLKRAKKINNKIKILLEIPTYPYDNEIKINILNFLLIIKDRWNRRKLKKYVDRIITYSKDKLIFGIETINLSNAIDIETITPKKITYDNNINVIAVANFNYWHGYDRFIKGMGKYYKDNKSIKKKIILHLVGNGEELEYYKKLVKEYDLFEYVLFYGEKDGNELDGIYNKCEIALDAMGRHRSGVFYNSSLKSKEYGAKGLPIISGVETELDSDKDYKYYMRVSSDDRPIDMNKVIEFYNSIYNSNEEKEKIILNIHEYTIRHFGFPTVWKPVIEFVKG
jgi:hypothetical protein